MRIAYFCQYFIPESAAPAARVSELAGAWAAAGHHVTVVTGLPNHPTGRVLDTYRGVVFRQERIGIVEVWRNWLYATPNEGLVKKTLSHLSFMVSTLILSVPRLRRADILIVSSPTFFVVITVCLGHWLWRVPYIFEVRDLWPGVFVELGVLKNRLLIRLLEWLEMFLYRRAALVVVVTDSFREALIRRGLPPEHVAVVTNGVDVNVFRPNPEAAQVLRDQHRIASRFVVLYVGAHGISHALSRILEVASRFRDESEVCFAFVGDGAEKPALARKAEEMGLTNVRLFPLNLGRRYRGGTPLPTWRLCRCATFRYLTRSFLRRCSRYSRVSVRSSRPCAERRVAFLGGRAARSSSILRTSMRWSRRFGGCAQMRGCAGASRERAGTSHARNTTAAFLLAAISI